ncbi:taurine ABC transporter substrate-binding protein [Hwanghaeella grinnelliae]|uniref:Taurine ABC transporter substrate-binding protein n=1 Tax=Hwanghaeella grinnelliae TaxID=2500179 RepID=A0A437QWB9_9PROT|nr:ABC transporter substrate-binding protein [Hwanghaeella grinnelliae]RVU38830.1 taurine ABC transporter substrate-binding protein [Hwanghaeella grinnelliae]
MKFVTVLKATVAGLALLTAASAAHAGTMKLGMTTWVGYGPLFLARDLGYFEEGGLEVDLQIVEDHAYAMAAEAAGELDGDAGTLDEILQYRTKDFCTKTVYALDDSHGGDGILAPTDVKSIADLKGMEVAMNEGSVSQFWFDILLKREGMTEADVVVTNMSADDAAAAFMADRIPVAITWEPHLTLAKKANKGHVLIDSSQTPGVIVDVLSLRCDYIENHPEDVKALVAGLYKAHEYLKANQDEAYKIMAKGVGGWLEDPKDFADAASGVNFYGKERNLEFFKGNADGEAGKLIMLGREIWGEAGKVKMKDITFDDAIDASFLGL